MKKLAGLLTEGEYSKALLRESKKDITKEMLSSKEQETINYILGDNIEEVEMGTAQFDTVGNYDYQEVLSRLKKVAKRGLLTIAILSTVFTACDLNSQQQQDVVDTVKTEVQDQQLSQELGWMREAALANSLYSNPRDKKRIDKLAETDFGVKYLITNQNFLNYDKLDAEEKMYIGKDYEDAIKVIRAEFNIPL
jgi:3-deoxy-D-arabino-heptulosonate 7-phosphate (DAHP) synthase